MDNVWGVGPLLYAFAVMEGFFDGQHSRPFRNHNPLDLEYCDEAIHFGAIHTDGRFAVFPDAATGWVAGRRWLSVPAHFDAAGNLIGGYLGATMRQVIHRFAPPSENNSALYLEQVCLRGKVTPETILTAELLR